MKQAKAPVKLICLHEPKSPAAEAYRTLRTNIQFAGLNRKIKTLMVASAGPGEGKTTTIANLAVVMAMTGKRTILVDTDLRRPTVHRAFQLTNRVGLTNYLTRQARFPEIIHTIPEIHLDVITSGPTPPNPTEFIQSNAMQSLVHELGRLYDIVLFDAPPILPVTDGQLLASYVDAVLLVLRASKVLQTNAERMKSLLDHVGANVIGTVLNNKKMDTNVYHY
ncbi:CpsD/CapB family tyrosine-protein kinase [Brevibacillus fluminis]|uniref:CpsD/CapB family tyrosine-protein kinase n=1 Tax=Brevibacillus fluminis TaxID=511487 RepID=UPI003F8B4CD2